jgi:signal transduction histidine kinase
VEGTGIGMDPETAERLFGLFRQESEGVSHECEGTGLGLTIAKRAAGQMDGTIEVETEKGEEEPIYCSTSSSPRGCQTHVPGVARPRAYLGTLFSGRRMNYSPVYTRTLTAFSVQPQGTTIGTTKSSKERTFCARGSSPRSFVQGARGNGVGRLSVVLGPGR